MTRSPRATTPGSPPSSPPPTPRSIGSSRANRIGPARLTGPNGKVAEEHNKVVEAKIAPVRERAEALEKEARSKLLDRRLERIPEDIRADTKAALLLKPEARDAVQAYLAKKFASLAWFTVKELTRPSPSPRPTRRPD